MTLFATFSFNFTFLFPIHIVQAILFNSPSCFDLIMSSSLRRAFFFLLCLCLVCRLGLVLVQDLDSILTVDIARSTPYRGCGY
jgi:hypothetical protein